MLKFAPAARRMTSTGIRVGGTGPGLLAVLLSTLAINFFLTPQGTLAIRFHDAPNLAAFLVSALLVSSWSAARRRAEEALRESEQRFRRALSRRIVMILACSIRPPASRTSGGSSSLLSSRTLSLARVFCATDEPVASSRALLPPSPDRLGCLLVALAHGGLQM